MGKPAVILATICSGLSQSCLSDTLHLERAMRAGTAKRIRLFGHRFWCLYEGARPPSTVFVWFVVPKYRREAGKIFVRDASACSYFRAFTSEKRSSHPICASAVWIYGFWLRGFQGGFSAYVPSACQAGPARRHVYKTASPALQGSPQRRGVCTRVYTQTTEEA